MINLNKIKKVYNLGQIDECVALQNISVTFPDSGLVLLEGESGSGKTTLLNIVAGIDNATEGQIQNTQGKDSCSIIFQDFQLMEMLTIKENLELILRIMPTARMDLETLIEKYGLKEILNHYPNQISGGQKQRVAIIRAILENRPIIICDEPTGNLDEENSEKIVQLLYEEAKNKLVIVASHDIELFEKYCVQHLILKKGTIVKNAVLKKDETISKRDKKEVPNIQVRLPVGQKLFLSFKFFKKSLTKNILTMISLLFSLIILLSALNGLSNTKASMIYNGYKSVGMETIDFSSTSKEYEYIYASMDDNDYEKIKKKNQNLIQFIDMQDNGYVFNDFVIQRFYISETCPQKLVCGSANTGNKHIIISDYIANELLEKWGLQQYEELLGRSVDSFGTVIGGVFEVGVALKGNYIDYSRFYNVAYIARETIINQYGNSVYINAEFSGYNATVELTKNVPSKILYGSADGLENGEIGLSRDIALEYSQVLESLIGKKIKINFYNERYHFGDCEDYYAVIEKEYTVKYIFSSGMYRINVAEEEYSALARSYNNNLYSYCVWGASLGDYSKNDISFLIEEGYTDFTYLSSEFESGRAWLNTLYWVELILGIVLFIITDIIICNHIITLIDKEKNALGVLISLGVKVKDTMGIYVLNVFICMFICFLGAALGEIGVVAGLNLLLKEMNISTLNILFYEPISLLLLVSVLIIFSAFILLVVARRLSKKQVVDIIYCR